MTPWNNMYDPLHSMRYNPHRVTQTMEPPGCIGIGAQPVGIGGDCEGCIGIGAQPVGIGNRGGCFPYRPWIPMPPAPILRPRPAAELEWRLREAELQIEALRARERQITARERTAEHIRRKYGKTSKYGKTKDAGGLGILSADAKDMLPLLIGGLGFIAVGCRQMEAEKEAEELSRATNAVALNASEALATAVEIFAHPDMADKIDAKALALLGKYAERYRAADAATRANPPSAKLQVSHMIASVIDKLVDIAGASPSPSTAQEPEDLERVAVGTVPGPERPEAPAPASQRDPIADMRDLLGAVNACKAEGMHWLREAWAISLEYLSTARPVGASTMTAEMNRALDLGVTLAVEVQATNEKPRDLIDLANGSTPSHLRDFAEALDKAERARGAPAAPQP